MKAILFFDRQLTHLLQNFFPHSPFFNYFFSFFSLTGNSIIIWFFVIMGILIFEEKKNPGISKNDKKFLVIFTLSFLIAAFLVEFPLKNFFHRPRPVFYHLNSINSHRWQPILTGLTCPSNYSFPSGHSATAFAAATVLTFFDKKRKWIYYLIATTIAYSRIYLGCHYFFDVLFGAFFGWITAKLTIKGLKIF